MRTLLKINGEICNSVNNAQVRSVQGTAVMCGKFNNTASLPQTAAPTIMLNNYFLNIYGTDQSDQYEIYVDDVKVSTV